MTGRGHDLSAGRAPPLSCSARFPGSRVTASAGPTPETGQGHAALEAKGSRVPQSSFLAQETGTELQVSPKKNPATGAGQIDYITVFKSFSQFETSTWPVTFLTTTPSRLIRYVVGNPLKGPNCCPRVWGI